MIDLHKLDKFRLKDREREFYGCTLAALAIMLLKAALGGFA